MRTPKADPMPPYRILFVCRGNTCRSPMAEGLLRDQVARLGRTQDFKIGSAGIAASSGSAADPRAVSAAAARGIDISAHTPRALSVSDFAAFNLLLAADQGVYDAIAAAAPSGHRAQIRLAMDCVAGSTVTDIADPWAGGPADYAHALDLITQVVDHIIAASPTVG
jgi:protein-tyrosine phosphatase